VRDGGRGGGINVVRNLVKKIWSSKVAPMTSPLNDMEATQRRARELLAKIENFTCRLKGTMVPALSAPATRVLEAAAAGQPGDPEQLKRALTAAERLSSQLVFTFLRLTTPGTRVPSGKIVSN
jgi:hypothetical protein